MDLTSLLLAVFLSETCIGKLIDLSHDHGPNTYMAGTNDPYKHAVKFQGDIKPGIYAEFGTLSSGEHGGTHIDSPRHFNRNGKMVHQLTLEQTIMDGVMIDLSEDCNGNFDYVMPLTRVQAWEQEHGRIPKGSAVVVNFGWSSRFDNPLEYVGTENTTDLPSLRYPIISTDAAVWLMNERDIKILAIDTMGPDKVTNDYPVHQVLLGNGRVIVENVKGPERLPARGFRLHAAPVKFLEASGTQIRLYAMTYDDEGNKGTSLLLLPFPATSALCTIATVLVIVWERMKDIVS